MNLTIGSPDGLGDFILRMPLVEALLEAGHKLQLVMRPPASELARSLFPEVEVIELNEDPFHSKTKQKWRPFRQALRKIRAFSPDLYIAGAFQLTFFDEIFLECCSKDLPIAGFVCEGGFWHSDTSKDPHELTRRFLTRCAVQIDLPEGDKYRLLAKTILAQKQHITKRTPRPPTTQALDGAYEILAQYGLKKKEFVVVCAGSRPGLVMKDWGERNWAALMKEISNDESRAFVFLGNPKESASIDRLRAALPAGVRSVNLASAPPSISVSYALVSMAQAYLGRDSGVMHMAAATNVPLLAVFSGGHWPRFLPEASRGIILTRQAPCRGCNFYCPFPEPWCVTTVPVEAVADAWGRLENANDLQIEELPATEAQLALPENTNVSAYAHHCELTARSKRKALRTRHIWQNLPQRFFKK